MKLAVILQGDKSYAPIHRIELDCLSFKYRSLSTWAIGNA